MKLDNLKYCVGRKYSNCIQVFESQVFQATVFKVMKNKIQRLIRAKPILIWVYYHFQSSTFRKDKSQLLIESIHIPECLASHIFFAHDNKYAYVEFNTLENQYTVQNYRYYATNQHRLFAQPQENELVSTFFFAFVTAACMSFVLIFRRRPPREWKVIIDILPESESFVNSCMHGVSQIWRKNFM